METQATRGTPATQETPVVQRSHPPRPEGNRVGFLTGNRTPKANREPKAKLPEKKRRARKVAASATVGTLLLIGGCSALIGNAEGSDKPSDRIAQDANPSDVKPKTPDSSKASATSAVKSESTAKSQSASAEIAEAESVPTLADVEMFYENGYVNVDTGDNMKHLISQFEISSDNPEQSVNNFYNDLRHNPESLGFWTACVGTGTPSYEACAENPDVLNFAEKLVADFRVMPVEEKAVHAENLIDQFKEMTFLGVPELDGSYDTVSIDENGKEIYASTNYRENDPRLRFEKDGVVFDIRGCAQITRGGEAPQPIVETAVPAAPTPEAPAAPQQPAAPVAPPEIVVNPGAPEAPKTPPTVVKKKTPTTHTTPTTGKTTQTTKKSTTTTENTTTTQPVESTTTTENTTTTQPVETTQTPTTLPWKVPSSLPTSPEFPDPEPGDPGINPDTPAPGNTDQDPEGYVPGEVNLNPEVTAPVEAPINTPDAPSDGTVLDPSEAGVIPGNFSAMQEGFNSPNASETHRLLLAGGMAAALIGLHFKNQKIADMKNQERKEA